MKKKCDGKKTFGRIPAVIKDDGDVKLSLLSIQNSGAQTVFLMPPVA